MNESVLFWALVAFSYMGGAGTLAVIWLFRTPDPGRRAKGGEPAEQPPPRAAAQPLSQPAAPRTLHHEYDTMDIYADAYKAGLQEGKRLPFGTAGVQGWESGSGGPPQPSQDGPPQPSQDGPPQPNQLGTWSRVIP